MPIQRITSAANPKLKLAIRLRESRYRRRTRQCLVDGEREIARALDADMQLIQLFVSETHLDNTESATGQIQRNLRNASPNPPEPAAAWWTSTWDPSLVLLDQSLMQKLSYGQRDSQVIGQFQTPARKLGELSVAEQPQLLLILDRIEKPGNVGAMLRTADATGCSAVIICDSSGDLFHPNVIRASSGAVFSLPIALCDHEEAANYLESLKIHLVSTEVEASLAPWDIDWSQPIGMLVGNEAQGISDFWQRRAAQAIRIPMLGHADSLNASISVAVCLYESVRQRQKKRSHPD